MTTLRSTMAMAEESCDEVCTLHMGGEKFAIRLTDIFEVTPAAVLRPCPLSPAYIAGLMQYRGEVLAAVSLRTLLGLPSGTGSASSIVMIGTHGLFALQVDTIGEVLSIATSTYESMTATVELQRQTLFSGTYKLERGLLPLLDAKSLEPSALRSRAEHAHPHPHLDSGPI